MSNLAVLSLKNRALIALITIVAAVFGGLALTSLKQELIPSIEFPQLVVVSTYPGASPEVVSNDVSVPDRDRDPGRPRARVDHGDEHDERVDHPGVLHLRHRSRDRRAEDHAGDQPHQGQLPEGVEPNVISASIDDFPVIQLAVTGYDDEETIQAQLEASSSPSSRTSAGVNAAAIVGGVGQRVTITPDQEALAAGGLHAAGDPRRPRPERRAVPRRRDHRGRPDPHRADRLQDHVGRRDRRTPARAVRRPSSSRPARVTIADVATVEQDQDPVTTISRVDGEPALTIAVTKLPAANTVDVSHRRARGAPRPRGQHSAARSSPSSSTRRPTSSSRSRRSRRRACSASSSPCSSSWSSCCRCARPS